MPPMKTSNLEFAQSHLPRIVPAMSARTSAGAAGAETDSARITVSLSIHVGERWRAECSLANC